jgi:hypothetical protein
VDCEFREGDGARIVLPVRDRHRQHRLTLRTAVNEASIIRQWGAKTDLSVRAEHRSGRRTFSRHGRDRAAIRRRLARQFKTVKRNRPRENESYLLTLAGTPHNRLRD